MMVKKETETCSGVKNDKFHYMNVCYTYTNCCVDGFILPFIKITINYILIKFVAFYTYIRVTIVLNATLIFVHHTCIS
jgi:hypothetical protein